MTEKTEFIKRRLKKISVTKLQDTYDYQVDFPEDSNNIILIAPNGFGKTALLAILKASLEFDLRRLEYYRFETFTIIFNDGTKWKFERSGILSKSDEIYYQEIPDIPADWRRRRRRRYPLVKATFFDANDNEVSNQQLDWERIDPTLLIRAVERFLPSHTLGYDFTREVQRGNILAATDLIQRLRPEILGSEEFRDFLKRSQPDAMVPKDQRLNCVFIETQRLMNAKKTAGSDNTSTESQEEVLRQAHQLSVLLQRTYSNYASISQSLDRSFPNRLIERAKVAVPDDPFKLRQDLNAIEKKRERLTEAGILVEQSEQLVPPADEYLPRVADALQIYVTDSHAKLATFDAIYPKISVFRELLSKKLKPKELLINREKGAEVRREDKKVALDALSSGEKHEFIMLYKLIFETPEQSVVLIDEPEISLHVLWQLEFMPDLIKIQQANIFQSIIATHSPQIFQGHTNIIVDLADQVAQ